MATPTKTTTVTPPKKPTAIVAPGVARTAAPPTKAAPAPVTRAAIDAKAPAAVAPQNGSAAPAEAGKPRKSMIDRTRGNLARTLRVLMRLDGRARSWAEKAANNEHLLATSIGLTDATAKLTSAVNAFMKLPADFKLPRTAAGASVVFAEGEQVVIKKNRIEVYADAFIGEDSRTLTITKVVDGGKRVMCKTSGGLRLMLAKNEISLAGQEEDDDEEEAEAEGAEEEAPM